MWGHKKLHIFLGSLMTPLFLLQFYIINGMGAFMLTPGFREAEASLTKGLLGWDKVAFYNPSFLMLTLHRALANVSYGALMVAGICGVYLYLVKTERLKKFFEAGGQVSFYTGFIAFLSIPIVGYFYALVLKYHANEAYVNLMWGRGDVVAGGVDWWWVKQIAVVGMLGLCLGYFRKTSRTSAFALPNVMVYSVGLFYAMYYIAMGSVMTWAFAWWMLGIGLAAYLAGNHLVSYNDGSGRSAFLVVGVLSALTVALGGYVREASRPRFVNRHSHYDKVYVPEQRQPYLMVSVDPSEIPEAAPEPPPPAPVGLIRERCSGCHTLERVRNYRVTGVWPSVVKEMCAYGLKLTKEEMDTIAKHLESGEPY
jgi:hypothetical protein